jgi:hypothetical protein
LQTVAVLTELQVAKYDQLRGYTVNEDGQAPAPGGEGSHDMQHQDGRS